MTRELHLAVVSIPTPKGERFIALVDGAVECYIDALNDPVARTFGDEPLAWKWLLKFSNVQGVE